MNTTSSYWRRSLSRRRALAGGASLGLAGLSVVGCGGDDSGSSSTSGGSSATLDPTKGKPGGTLKMMLTGPLPGLTIVDRSFVGVYRLAGLVHSGLLAFRWGQESVPLTDFSFEPDLATALPEQPDDQTLVFKLRTDAKFHNGRTVVAEDIRYSFDRFANWDKSVWRGAWQPWFERADTPDAQTVVIKTKLPFADALEGTAANTDGFILAKEHEESAQANDKMVGSGPFTFVSSEAPVSWTFRKNPDYYLKPFPYFNDVIVYSTTDPVRRITNFTTREVHMPWLVYADERDQIKGQRPDAAIQNHDYPASTIYLRGDKPPFNDRRVRQALSMTIDRKKIRDAVTKGEGVDDQFFPLAHKDIFGTRQVKELSAAAKNWEYNPTEARRLLQAAGVDRAIEANMTHYDPSVVGQWYVDQIVLTQSNWRELNIANARLVSLIGAQFQATAQQGQYEGMAVGLTGLNSRQRGTNIRNQLYWAPGGDRAQLNQSYVNDPRLNVLIDKQIRQLKDDERKQTYREMETIMADEQYIMSYSSTLQSWFWDPSLRNVRFSTQQGSIRYKMRWWFDS